MCPANAQSAWPPAGPRDQTFAQIIITASTSSADALARWMRYRRRIPDQKPQAFACFTVSRMLGGSTKKVHPDRQIQCAPVQVETLLALQSQSSN
jgi:hypothetical protein